MFLVLPRQSGNVATTCMKTLQDHKMCCPPLYSNDIQITMMTRNSIAVDVFGGNRATPPNSPLRDHGATITRTSVVTNENEPHQSTAIRSFLLLQRVQTRSEIIRSTMIVLIIASALVASTKQSDSASNTDNSLLSSWFPRNSANSASKISCECIRTISALTSFLYFTVHFDV